MLISRNKDKITRKIASNVENMPFSLKIGKIWCYLGQVSSGEEPEVPVFLKIRLEPEPDFRPSLL